MSNIGTILQQLLRNCIDFAHNLITCPSKLLLSSCPTGQPICEANVVFAAKTPPKAHRCIKTVRASYARAWRKLDLRSKLLDQKGLWRAPSAKCENKKIELEIQILYNS